MIATIHRFLDTLYGNHHRRISVHDQFTVFIVSVRQFFRIQFQRNCIAKNSFFHPERFRPVIHGINIGVQNDPGSKSHSIQDPVTFHILNQKTAKPFLYQFGKCFFPSVQFPVTDNPRQCQKQFFSRCLKSVYPRFHILCKVFHRENSAVRIDSADSVCLCHNRKLFFCLYCCAERSRSCLFFDIRNIFRITFLRFSLFPRTKHLFLKCFECLSSQMV